MWWWPNKQHLLWLYSVKSAQKNPGNLSNPHTLATHFWHWVICVCVYNLHIASSPTAIRFCTFTVTRLIVPHLPSWASARSPPCPAWQLSSERWSRGSFSSRCPGRSSSWADSWWLWCGLEEQRDGRRLLQVTVHSAVTITLAWIRAAKCFHTCPSYFGRARSTRMRLVLIRSHKTHSSLLCREAWARRELFFFFFYARLLVFICVSISAKLPVWVSVRACIRQYCEPACQPVSM